MEYLDKRESCSKIMEDYYKHLDEMRRRGTFCDAHLICRDDKRHSFPIHRAVLASCSPYFRALFTSGMTEAQNLHVEIPGIGSEAMNAIISYAYTRKFEISTDNVENLLSAADRFHVFGILKACGDFLYSQLSVENCLGIYKFANFHHCEQLSRKVWSYILIKFCDIAEESTEFLQLDISDLTTMLADDELNVRFEEDAFDAAVRWINFMPQARKRYYCELLPNFRLGHINTDYFLEHVYTNPEIQHRRDCQSVMKEAWDTIQSIRAIGVVSSDARNPFLRPRVPHEVIFLVGGWARNGVTMSVETYDTRADKWYHAHPTLCAPRAYHGSVAMNNLIYVVGGYDGTRYHNSVLCFDPIKVAWREVAPMYAARCYVAVAALNGYVYACGGYDGRLRHNSVERYNPRTNQWSYVASMHRQRSDSGSAAVSGKLYVAGGFDGQACLDSAEVYDSELNQWTLLNSMSKRRSGMAAVAYGNNFYVLGGYDGLDRLESVEKCNSSTGLWSHVTNMSFGRSNFAVTVQDEMIFIIGGYDGNSTSAVVECYDVEADTWYDGSDLNVGRSATSACTISGIPNTRQYTFYGHMTSSE